MPCILIMEAKQGTCNIKMRSVTRRIELMLFIALHRQCRFADIPSLIGVTYPIDKRSIIQTPVDVVQTSIR